MRLVCFILTLQMLGEVLRDFSLLFKSEKTQHLLQYSLVLLNFFNRKIQKINYFGVLWQVLNPLILMMAYWFVFGMRNSKLVITGIGEVPFIV